VTRRPGQDEMPPRMSKPAVPGKVMRAVLYICFNKEAAFIS